MMTVNDQLLAQWMAEAVEHALRGVASSQAPFAAAIYSSGGERISQEYNQVRQLCDPSAHAEVMAIRRAAEQLGQPKLSGCWLISTCEPCPMCAATAVFAEIGNVAYGTSVATAQQAGFRTLGQACTETFAHAPYRVQVHGPVLEKRCSELLLSHPAQPG